MGKKEQVARQVSEILPSFLRRPELEVGGTLVFGDAQRTLGVDYTARKGAVYLLFAKGKIDPGNELWSSDSRITRKTLGPIDMPLLGDWLAHFSECNHILESDLEEFKSAREPSASEKSRFRDEYERLLLERLATLGGDIPKPELRTPLGLFVVKSESARVTSVGRVPSFARLCLDSRSSALDDLGTLGWQSTLSRKQKMAILDGYFQQIQEEVTEGKCWILDTPKGEIRNTRTPKGWTVEIDQEFALNINRGNAVYKNLLRDLGDRWREVYDAIDDVEDPAARLEAAAENEPMNMRRWRELSSHFFELGEEAKGHLALAKGYISKASWGIARGKLELAFKACANEALLKDIRKLQRMVDEQGPPGAGDHSNMNDQ